MVFEHILSITIFFPLIGVLALFTVNKENTQVIKLIGLFTTALTFVISLALYFQFDASAPGFQFKEYAWSGCRISTSATTWALTGCRFS